MNLGVDELDRRNIVVKNIGLCQDWMNGSSAMFAFGTELRVPSENSGDRYDSLISKPLSIERRLHRRACLVSL